MSAENETAALSTLPSAAGGDPTPAVGGAALPGVEEIAEADPFGFSLVSPSKADVVAADVCNKLRGIGLTEDLLHSVHGAVQEVVNSMPEFTRLADHQARPAAPEGAMVLVPREPTEAMLDAMRSNPNEVRSGRTILQKYRERYDRLLAAALASSAPAGGVDAPVVGSASSVEEMPDGDDVAEVLAVWPDARSHQYGPGGVWPKGQWAILTGVGGTLMALDRGHTAAEAWREAAILARTNAAAPPASRPTASEIAREQDAYLKGYDAAKELFGGAALDAGDGGAAAGDLWRHVKRGTVYERIGEAELQWSGPEQVEGEPLTVYRAVDGGKLWARPSGEFEDGRFVPAPPTTSTTTGTEGRDHG